MNSLIVYLIKTGIGISVLYSMWYIFLKNDTSYTQNRFFILVSTILVLIIPAINFPTFSSVNNALFSKTLDVITIGTNNSNFEKSSYFSLINSLIVVYIIGVIIFSINFLIKAFTVTNLILRNKAKYYNGIKIISTKKEYSSFSFMHYVFIPEKDIATNDFDQIFKHEVVHIKQLHSLDILIFELLCILQWFNPFVYFLKKALKETHEYLADKGVIEQGYSLTDYQLLLLEQCVGVQYGFTNNFNKSLTLKRLTMMNKISNNKTSKKVLFALPIVISMLLVFACSNKESLNNEIKSLKDYSTKTENVVAEPEVMPEFPGGVEALMTYLGENITYPTLAKEQGLKGKVFVSFVINKEGKVVDVEVVQSDNEMLNRESVRVISTMPEWTPGTLNGEPVDCSFTIPITYQLQ